MRKTSGVLADTTELKNLIAEHPDYPIAVMCGEECNCGDYSWMFASDIRFDVGEILNCEQPVDDCQIFTDRDYFEERLEEWLWDELNQPDVEEIEFQKKLAEEKAKYEPHWKDCIFIYADN